VVAIFLEHWKVGFFMNWRGEPGRGEGWEYAFMILSAALALVLAGPGRHALFDRDA